MASFDEFLAAVPRSAATAGDTLRLATIAYLARYMGDSRMHAESDLRIYLAWCTERNLVPLTVQRVHVELYMRWLQEVRRFRPRRYRDACRWWPASTTCGTCMDRHTATRQLRQLAADSVVRLPRMQPHMLRPTFVTTMLDAGVDLRDVQIAARHADPPHHHALRPSPQQPRSPPQLRPRRLHGLRHT
ncbi:MAG: tyrosine-type recombinase/integrase [Gemmatimonadales bacterium]|nr:tyrosine-type recombinase/integrase [Gemmatimonadales bacterium]